MVRRLSPPHRIEYYLFLMIRARVSRAIPYMVVSGEDTDLMEDNVTRLGRSQLIDR